MPTPTKGPRLGGGPAHERLILANLATALFEHGRLMTTEAKAKRLRPLAERLVTFAKRGDLHARRRVLRVVRDKEVVHTLFAEIGPRFAARAGGYTRITKIGPRKGDNAPMAMIELVEGQTLAQSVVGEAEQARGTRFARRRGAAAAAASTAGDAGPEEPAEATDQTEQTDQTGQTEQPEQTDEAPVVGAADETPAEQVAVPTEGGDTEVVTEPEEAAAEPAEEGTGEEGA